MRYPNIEAERARSGLTYEDLAMKIGVTRKTLYNWFRSGDVPKDKAEKMASLFGAPVEYLLKRES